MNDETTRRSFFSALALSPLAWLGLRKKDPVPYPISARKPTDKEIEQVRRWFRDVKDNGKEAGRWRVRALDADYWEGRALRAEFDMECMGAAPVDEDWMRQLRMEEQEQGTARSAKVIRDELQELRKETA